MKHIIINKPKRYFCSLIHCELFDLIHKSKLVPEYLVYRLTAKSPIGHGIHSPFVFSFLQEVVRERQSIPNLTEVERLHKDLAKSSESITTGNYGAGTKSLVTPLTLGQLVKTSSVSHKTGGLLYRLCQREKPKYILEMGTSVGISTMYLAAANPDSRIVTLEGDFQKIMHARNIFQQLNLHNVSILEGDFEYSLDEALTMMPRVDMVFFDGNHKTEPTLRYFKKCLELKHEKSIFVFDDIRWSKEMFNTWQIIQTHKSVTISIDLFNLGIVFFRSGITKQHFTINF